MSAVLTENRPDGRRDLVNVWQHDHHIARLYWRIGACGVCKQLQKLIVQHLHLAHDAVRHMEHD